MNKTLPAKNNHQQTTSPETFWRTAVFIVTGLFFVSLYPLSRTNYLLFHTLVELSSVAVAITVFSIGWNTRNITRNDGFTLLAISFLVVAGLDLLHTLAYKGIGVFPHAGTDLPTQLWITARFVEAVSFLLAALLFGRIGHIRPWRTLAVYLCIGLLLGFSIWPWRIFPDCMLEGSGLTSFKIAAEYLICVILLSSGLIFYRKRAVLEKKLLKLLLLSIAVTTVSELCFTVYQDIYGLTSILGHFLKLIAVVLIYRTLVFGALTTPYQLLFRELHQSNKAFDAELQVRRETEEQLRITNSELEAFVRTASHDLRRPLTAITSATELLQTELNGKIQPDQEEILASIKGQTFRMARLLKDLLCLAKIGSLEQEPQALEPALVAAEAIEDLSQEIMARKCRVNITEMPTLQAHHSLIYQLFLNLIGNAIRYGCDQGETVQVGADIIENRYQIYVRDHGPGVPQEEREKIFDVFYRIDHEQPIGTGIGLAIVQKIARYYGGRAYVEETPGGGATFLVEIESPGSANDAAAS